MSVGVQHNDALRERVSRKLHESGRVPDVNGEAAKLDARVMAELEAQILNARGLIQRHTAGMRAHAAGLAQHNAEAAAQMDRWSAQFESAMAQSDREAAALMQKLDASRAKLHERFHNVQHSHAAMIDDMHAYIAAVLAQVGAA